MPPAVSIVIPVHNAVQYTAACIASIDRHTPQTHEVVLVDNGSTDATAEWFARRDEGVLIRNPHNLGFAAAVNQGMAAAEGDTVVILNNDTLVTHDWLGGLLRGFTRDPAIGITAPVSNYVTGSQLVNTVDYTDAPSEELEEFARARARQFVDSGFGVERLAGLCMAISRSVIESIGGFDTAFQVGNFEDDDYSVRARLAGFRLWVASDSYIHHFGGRTFDLLDEAYHELLGENAVRFMDKWDIPPGLNPKNAEPRRAFDPARDTIPLTGSFDRLKAGVAEPM